MTRSDVRTVVFSFTLLIFAATTLAFVPSTNQTQLSVVGLESPRKATVIEVAKAEQSTLSAREAAKRNRSGSAPVIVITRKVDEYSDKLKSAATNGTVFLSGKIRGEVSENFGRFYFIDYNRFSVTGEGNMEQFKIIFERGGSNN